MGGKFCACRWWCSALWTCSLVFGWLQAETIHFTNSPKLIMASKNFTTYEIEVPGSKPITIIEATDPYDRGAGNTHRLDTTFPKEVQLPGGPTTSFRTSTGLSVSRPTPDGEESSSSSVEHSAGSRKTLYSPELLNKFLKEYSEKLRNADSATRKRLNEITMINNNINRNQNELVPGVAGATGMSADENQYRNKHHPHLDAIQAESQSGTDTDSDRSRPPEDEPKTEDEFVFSDTHERHVSATNSNKRWYQETGLAANYQAQSPPSGHKNHPWNIKDGWVTLEAVPWSESKVSKWHATGSVSELNKHSPGKVTTMQHALDKYWSAGTLASEEHPKYKPVATSGSIGASSYYHEDADDGYGYGSPHNRLPSSSVVPPTESFYNRRHPTATLYSERPDADRNRPSSVASAAQPQQLDSWYDQQPLHSSDPYDSMKAYHDHPAPYSTPSTSNRDIITDGRPANFPKFAQDRPGQQAGYGVDNTPQSQRVRPVSYPDRGNGEWVLISTTKGYQYPKRRHGQRAITFSPAASTSHQTVKLTVLPMKNAIDMTTSHNGLIEVSSSTQTVEDAVKQQKSKRKGQHPATTAASSLVGHKKKKHSSGASASSQTFSLMRRDATQDSSAVLAAVSAGMVPATMAILAPMVLGRKKK